MPGTRSSGKHPRHSPRKPTSLPDSEVIVISDDEQPVRKKSSKKPGSSSARTKFKASPPCTDGDILEIITSSDDENFLLKKAGTSSELMTMMKVQSEKEKELEVAKQEAAAAKLQADEIRRDLAQLLQENAKLKAAAAADKPKFVLNPSQLEDSISCEICTLKMWRPYILPECGHVFCLFCLEDWFSTTLAQHMTTHPAYVLNPPIPAHLRQLSIQARNNPHLRMQLEVQAAQYRLEQNIDRPIYSCPTCREVVKNKPVEVYALKSVVRMISSAMGENSPRKDSVKTIAGPWEGFFPADFVL